MDPILEAPFAVCQDRVDLGDTDPRGIMTVEAHLRLLERARYQAFEALDPRFFSALVQQHQARIYKVLLQVDEPLRFGETLRVETGAAFSSVHRLAFYHRVGSEPAPIPRTWAVVELVRVDEAGQLTVWPEELRTRFEHPGGPPPAPGPASSLRSEPSSNPREKPS
jgi:acyl-CoA thioesterase FadM